MANLTSKPPTAPPAANIAALAVIPAEYRKPSCDTRFLPCLVLVNVREHLVDPRDLFLHRIAEVRIG
jgi:hypothetical protein